MNNKKINWKEKAKEMYKAGHDYSAISKALGINNNTIAKAFSRVPITERVAMKQDYYKNVIIPEPVELAGDDEQVPEKIDKGDYFIVNSNKVSVSITKIKLKLLKNLYCGQKMTINQACLELNIDRNDFHVIKTAFGITKDDVPVLDEELEDIDNCVEQSLQQKKKLYRTKLQAKEIADNQRELERYRSKDYWLEKARDIVADVKPCEYEPTQARVTSSLEAQLCLADWHIGMECDNHWNTFNLDVATSRVKALLEEVWDDCRLYNIETIHVMNLGDMIHGLIHVSTRVEAEFNVTRQVRESVNLIAMLLKELSQICEVKFYNTYGNHSRFTLNKKDALDTENFELLIPAMLEQVFADYPNITHVENEIDEQWIVADICGHCIVGTHGDRDKLKKAATNISMMYEKPYKIFIGHKHHLESLMEHSVEVKMVGSLCGVETFAKDIRKTSQPSQKLCIYDPQGLIHEHDIEL